MKNVSDFFRTTAVSKLEFYGHNPEDLFYEEEEEAMHRNLPSLDVDGSKISMYFIQTMKRILEIVTSIYYILLVNYA